MRERKSGDQFETSIDQALVETKINETKEKIKIIMMRNILLVFFLSQCAQSDKACAGNRQTIEGVLSNSFMILRSLLEEEDKRRTTLNNHKNNNEKL